MGFAIAANDFELIRLLAASAIERPPAFWAFMPVILAHRPGAIN